MCRDRAFDTHSPPSLLPYSCSACHDSQMASSLSLKSRCPVTIPYSQHMMYIAIVQDGSTFWASLLQLQASALCWPTMLPACGSWQMGMRSRPWSCCSPTQVRCCLALPILPMHDAPACLSTQTWRTICKAKSVTLLRGLKCWRALLNLPLCCRCTP